MNGAGLEVAAIITAVGGFIGMLLSNRNSAAKIAELQKTLKGQGAEIVSLKKYRAAARKQIAFLKRLLLKRESEINRLTARDAKWITWGDEVGRLLNQQQLEIGALQQFNRAHQPNDDTRPLSTPPRGTITGPLGPLGQDAVDSYSERGD